MSDDTPSGLRRSLPNSLRDSGRRLVRTITFRALLLFAAAGLATWAFVELADEVIEGESMPYDRAVLEWVQERGSGGLTAPIRFVTHLGDIGTLMASLAVAVAIAAWKRRWRTAGGLLLAGGTTVALIVGLKHLFSRPRPGLFAHVTLPESYSFPSGHAMGAMAIYGALAVAAARVWPRRKLLIGTLAGALILGIGLSRIYLGVHWPTDVLAGFAAGSPVVLATAFFMSRRTSFPPRTGSPDPPSP